MSTAHAKPIKAPNKLNYWYFKMIPLNNYVVLCVLMSGKVNSIWHHGTAQALRKFSLTKHKDCALFTFRFLLVQGKWKPILRVMLIEICWRQNCSSRINKRLTICYILSAFLPPKLWSYLRWGTRGDSQEVPTSQSQSAFCCRRTNMAR